MRLFAHWVVYSLWLIGQVFAGAWSIAVDALRPHSQMHPAVVRYPLRVTSDALVTAFSTSITMTPGTMSIGVIDDAAGVPEYLLVQAVFGADEQEVLDGLADMERRLWPAVEGGLRC